MEQFLDMMNRLSALEQREIVRSSVSLSAFAARLEKQFRVLAKNAGRSFAVLPDVGRETVWMDEAVVTEVLENLFTNALRYAKQTVTVVLCTAGICCWVTERALVRGPWRCLEREHRGFY